MRRIIAIVLGSVLAIAFVQEAAAKKDKGAQVSCQFRATSEWIPAQQIAEKAKGLGYEVWKVDQKRGCWEVHGYDRNGAWIRASFDPGTGNIVSARPRF